MKKSTFKIGDWAFDQNGYPYTVEEVFTDTEYPGVDFLTLKDKKGKISSYHRTSVFSKPRPILMSTDMVRATLEGRKTQTRRIIKNIPPGIDKVKPHGDQFICQHPKKSHQFILTGKYQPGDILYVRETFTEPEPGRYSYKADHQGVMADTGFLSTWKPSIHMPRQAARLFLKIEEVRVERLQDISEYDAEQEGVEPGYIQEHTIYNFSTLWDSINKDRADWLSNPWVWAITFKKLDW